MSDLCPTCFSEIGIWLDDPILTPKGLSGDEYIGNTEDNANHIRELQARCIEEEEINSVSPKTTFSAVGKNGKREFTLQHINEIRSSIEKILFAKAGGGSDIIPLFERYFNYDAEGNYMGTSKTNWTDTELDNKTKIKAIHIEDLRHPIPETEELPEYPGTGFLRRYTTLDLTNVHTTFNNIIGGGSPLKEGDTIQFTSNFSVKNTEVWYESFGTFKLGAPDFAVQGWNLTGNVGNITATLFGEYPDIRRIGVYASVQTDGTKLWHHKVEYMDPNTGEQVNIDVWELGDEPDLQFQYFEEATGEWENLEPILVDKENAPYTGWTSFPIWRAYKSDNSTDFSLFPNFTMSTQWIGDPPFINPAPGGYDCVKMGNGTPPEYWRAYNAKYGTSWGPSYIGHLPITVDLGDGKYRKYCNWGYKENIGGAPLRAEYRKDNKTLIYTCNI